MESNRREFIQTAILIVLLGIVFNLFFRIVIVSGASMEPTLYDGNVLIVSKMSKPEKNDIIVFWKDGFLIKRVVAEEGDRVASREGTIYVNGESAGKGECASITVPEGEYFVLGDNRDNSYDSRDFGCIDNYLGVVK